MTSPLLVADATNLTHRCWHATGRTSAPEPTAKMILSLLTAGVARSGANAAIIAFDGAGAGSHRYEMYPEYKAGRAEKDPALKNVLAGMPAALDALGVSVVQAPGAEADDVLATYAAEPLPTVLLTSDKDALGLLTHEHVSLLRVGNGGPSSWTLVTSATLEEHTGVTPEAYALYAALKGDTSDNIPGVSGIGPTYAAKLAAEFVTIAAFEQDVREGAGRITSVIGKARGARIAENSSQVLSDIALSEMLARAVEIPGLPTREQATLPTALTPTSTGARARSAAGEHDWEASMDEPAREEMSEQREARRILLANARPNVSPVATPSKPASYSDYF